MLSHGRRMSTPGYGTSLRVAVIYYCNIRNTYAFFLVCIVRIHVVVRFQTGTPKWLQEPNILPQSRHLQVPSPKQHILLPWEANVNLHALNVYQFATITALFSIQNPERRVCKAVREAIKSSFQHIDTAQQYRNEHEVGEAIRDEINEDIIKREAVFI